MVADIKQYLSTRSDQLHYFSATQNGTVSTIKSHRIEKIAECIITDRLGKLSFDVTNYCVRCDQRQADTQTVAMYSNDLYYLAKFSLQLFFEVTLIYQRSAPLANAILAKKETVNMTDCSVIIRG